MRVEDAEWNPMAFRWKRAGRKASASRLALRDLQVGDVKRIFHDDLACTIANPLTAGQRQCSLFREIRNLKKVGWELEYYHEAPQVLVVRRTK